LCEDEKKHINKELAHAVCHYLVVFGKMNLKWLVFATIFGLCWTAPVTKRQTESGKLFEIKSNE
jgi:hypothetical protein